MRFRTAPAPHVGPSPTVSGVMLGVLLALGPGILVQVWQFGPGLLVQLAIGVVSAEIAEACILKLRHRPIRPVLGDFSAVVTATLLAASLPPLLPWQLTVFGTCFAIVIAKQLYGGLGCNPFNPAMIGYAVLLISFPKAMTQWLPPLDDAAVRLGMADTVRAIFTNSLPSGLPFDAVTRATPLDAIKTSLRSHQSLEEIQAAAVYDASGIKGWVLVNLAYLIGGLWLWRRRLIAWKIPAAFLSALGAVSLGFFVADPTTYPTPLFHLFAGGTMLGAFFIATDPVSAATTQTGRWVYGAGIGLLVFVIRSFGGYPDGIAFAVLLMNLAAPTIDDRCRTEA